MARLWVCLSCPLSRARPLREVQSFWTLVPGRESTLGTLPGRSGGCHHPFLGFPVFMGSRRPLAVEASP